MHQASIVADKEVGKFEDSGCHFDIALTGKASYWHRRLHHAHDVLMQLRLLWSTDKQDLAANAGIERIR
jgi:hypothetical protein